MVGRLVVCGAVLAANARADEGKQGEASPAYQTTVTALRMPRPLLDVPDTVTVVSREELARTPAFAIDDVLRGEPSIGTFRRTPSLTADPSSQGLNLRGLGPSAVSRGLVLLDGVPVNDPFGGWIYWRSLPRLGLDRIEIAPGGSSALYGNYALGGVVQLVSRPLENAIDADVAAGRLGTRSVTARVAGRQSSVAGAIEGEFLDSEGYTPVVPAAQGRIDRPASSRHGTVNGRIAWTASEHDRLVLHGRFFEEHENGGTQFTTADVRQFVLGAGFDHDDTGWGGMELAVFATNTLFQQSRARVPENRAVEEQAGYQEVPAGSQGGAALWRSPVLRAAGEHRLILGADLRRVHGAADEAIYPAAITATSTVARTSGGAQLFLGAFVEEVYDPHPVLSIAAAVRVDRWWNVDGHRDTTRGNGAVENTSFDDRVETEVSPRLGVLVRPTADTRLRGSVYRSFRAPTLNELYRPFQVGTVLTAANESLVSEHLLGGELGMEWLPAKAAAIRLTGFWNLLDDPIANVTLSAPSMGAGRQRQNLGRTRVRGLELASDARLGRKLIVSLAYTLAEARVVSAPAQPEVEQKLLPQDPVHRARGEIAFRPLPRLQLALLGRAQSGQFEDDLNTLPMKPYLLIDVHAALGLGYGFQLYAWVQNLANQKYLVGRAGIDTRGPPRLGMVGLRYGL